MSYYLLLFVTIGYIAVPSVTDFAHIKPSAGDGNRGSFGAVHRQWPGFGPEFDLLNELKRGPTRASIEQFEQTLKVDGQLAHVTTRLKEAG